MNSEPVNSDFRPPSSNLAGWFVSILLVCASMASSPGAEALQTISLRHINSASAAGGGGNSSAPLMNPEGRYVLFASTARNLAVATNSLMFQGAARPVLNVYWRDRVAQRTLLATPGINETEFGDNNSMPVGLSTNGLLALIESTASNLVPNDTNSASDVFVRDLERGETVLVSMGTNGVPAKGASYNAVMTPDGRYVAFTSEAANLVANDTNNVSDIFLRDLQSGLIHLISTNLQPSLTLYTNLGSDFAQITPDGGKVAFVLNAKHRTTSKLTASINVRNLMNGTTLWASSEAHSALGLASTTEPSCFGHVLSDDGASLAYEATTSGSSVFPVAVLRYNLNTATTDVIHGNALMPSLVVDDVQNVDISADGKSVAFLAKTNAADSCVLVWDAGSGVCTLASANLTNGLPAAATCQAPRLDSQGRFVSFISSATGLVTNDLTSDYHMYRRDLVTGTTSLLDVDENGAGWPLASLSVPVLSADGRFVAFECVLPEPAGNQNSDIFVLDLQSGASDLVSQHAQGLASATASGSSFPSSSAITSDGRLAVFASDAEDVVANDENGFCDVFVRDMMAGTNLLVSVNNHARFGNGASFEPVISGNGRYIAFTSAAIDLVTGDNNSMQDVFVRDLQSAQTVLASVAYNGAAANSNSSLPAISHDGGYVLFRSFAWNLAQGGFTGENLFLRDMQQGTNFVLTSGASVFERGGTDMTHDGRFAIFSFRASAGSSYVRVWDTQLRKVILSNTVPAASPQVAISPDGSYIAWLSNSVGVYSTVLQNVSTGTKSVIAASSGKGIRPRFSGDGQWLVFSSLIQNTNQIYLRDLVNNADILVSRSGPGVVPATGDSDSPTISPDGRFVAYRSFAEDIVPNDTNGSPDVFLFDRVSETTVLLSCGQDGSLGNSRSGFPCFSSDGKTLTFSSWASNLDPLDFNEKPDLFAYALSTSGSSFYLQAVLSGGVPTLLWPAAPGKTYRVEYKNDLTQAGWQEAQGTVLINGGQGSYTDPAPATKRFFRLVAE